MERGDKKILLQKGIKSWGDKMGGIKKMGGYFDGGDKKVDDRCLAANSRLFIHSNFIPLLFLVSPCAGQSTDWSCCSSSSPCPVGGGDCDSDNQCGPGLMCGDKNCGDFHLNAHSDADCCVATEATGIS